ncbi:MAG: aldehyde ferredoxin oxidoreductase family protein [Dehalococcoidia bacterium]|nr:aldehyde ferredoxin oxidoreductase family protein [Dehalococcoidia bacterium]
MFGYMGQILRVDLTNGRVSVEALREDDCKMFLGGSGLATKYLFDEVPKGTDPLGPDNRLIFMTGPLTGTESPSAGRYCVVTKSPLTGFWGEGNSGGSWGVYLKNSGFDGIIFEGISPKPVYLVIDDGKAELKDAERLWGKGVGETTKLIKEGLGEDFNVACIGIAGENLVRYAGIFNDAHRPAGRCGVGAVMGSKRLKAVAARGTQEIKIANKDAFSQISKRNYDLVNESLLKITLETYGTAMVTDLVNVRGGFPTRNWQTGVVPDIDKISGITLESTLLVDRKHCYACPISCCRVSVVKSGPYACKGEGPEYETIGAFGAMCALYDLEAVTFAHNLCDEYGLDVISTGSTIAFAIECYEKGILTKADTDGLELKFGDADVVIQLIRKIARREGIGDLLAEGTKRVAAKLDKGAESFAMHVKGLELPAYDPRAAKICGLAFVTANRGGDHITAYVEGPAFVDTPLLCIEDSRIEDWIVENPAEAKVVKDLEDALTVFDCAGTCKFMGMALATQEWVDMIANCVGWEFTVSDFRKVGERVYNLARSFNVRDGLTRADDTLPKRLLEEPLPEGAAEGHTVKKLDQSLDAYYEFRGWGKKTGKPTPEKLKELNLDYVIDKI